MAERMREREREGKKEKGTINWIVRFMQIPHKVMIVEVGERRKTGKD